MAYHMLVAFDHSPGKPIFDKYLGSAGSIDTYWESIGRKLSLPIVSSITERADCEDGFVLEKEDLVDFRKEINEIEKFWKSANESVDVPSNFFDDLNDIRAGVNEAIEKRLKLMIG